MAGAIEKLQTINSLIRTFLGLCVLAGIGAVGWYGYATYNAAEIEASRKDAALAAKQRELDDIQQKARQQHERLLAQDAELIENRRRIQQQETDIEALNEEVKRQAAEVQRLDTALRLHKLEHRLARIRTLDTGIEADTGRTVSKIEFVELNESGDPVGEPKVFQINGDVVYIDYWVVKFDDKYVEQADLERGTSICMFHRLFGDQQKPKDGYTLDEPGQRPGTYGRGSVMSDFEKKIWQDFWSIANDPPRAAEMGIRALHGDAVSIKVEKGVDYLISVRSSAGPEITVDRKQPPPKPAS